MKLFLYPTYQSINQFDELNQISIYLHIYVTPYKDPVVQPDLIDFKTCHGSFRALSAIPHSSALQQTSLSHPIQNRCNTAPPPNMVMAPKIAPVKQTKLYDQRFRKKLILILSSIQLVMAVLVMITQAMGLSTSYPGVQIVGTGIWFGIFFALSGILGAITSSKPSFRWIVTFLVFFIISASFCLPLLVISPIGTTIPTGYYSRGDITLGYWVGNTPLGYVVSTIQIAISLVQAAAAIVGMSWTCSAVCDCCGARKECGEVNYNGSVGSNLKNAFNKHITVQEQQPAYINIPLNQIQVVVASAGATSLPTISMISGTAETDVIDNSAPPKYDTVAKMTEDKEEANGGKSQRF